MSEISEIPQSGQRTSITQVAIASWIGTSIEWYDFVLYGTASALVFSRLFFPTFDPFAGLLASFITFWVGFLGRLVGGIIFGHFGDRLGRKTMLILTLLLMGIATFLVGCLPGYATLGVLAPILLVTLRVIQGIAVGGEWGGAVLMTTEHAPEGRRGFYGSWPQIGSPVGILLSALMFSWAVTAFPQDQFFTIGWRIPFLVSIILVAFGLFIRLRITETPEFERVRATQSIIRVPILQVLRSDFKNVLLAAGIFFATNVSGYIFSTWSVSYGTQILKLPREVFLNAVSIASLIVAVLIPVAGALSDRFGRRIICMIGALYLALVAFPILWLVDTRSTPLIILALCVGAVSTSLMYGPLGAYFSELFGANVRYSGASLGYQLTSVLGGGLAPFIATVLLGWSGNASWPVALYLLTAALVTVVSIYLAKSYVVPPSTEQPSLGGSTSV